MSCLRSVLRSVFPFFRLPISSKRLISTGEFGPLVIPAKETKSVEVDLVNYGSPGIYFSAYNHLGFVLNSGVRIIGPCAAFPRNAFCWNVNDINEVDELSLSLFFLLEPKLDVLIIGKGATNVQVNHSRILKLCQEHNLAVDIMPTQAAVGTFNFLNSEGRYVAAALIPPRRLDIYDPVDREANRLLLAEEDNHEMLSSSSTDHQSPKLLTDDQDISITRNRSPLLGLPSPAVKQRDEDDKS